MYLSFLDIVNHLKSFDSIIGLEKHETQFTKKIKLVHGAPPDFSSVIIIDGHHDNHGHPGHHDDHGHHLCDPELGLDRRAANPLIGQIGLLLNQ